MNTNDTLDQVAVISANILEINNAQASYIAIYLTAIFAYIVAPHSAGASLTPFQVAVSNTVDLHSELNYVLQ